MNIIKKTAWVIKNPKHYKDAWYYLLSKMGAKSSAKKMAFAIEKCSELESDVATLSEIIPDFKMISLNDVHPQRYILSKQVEGDVPLKMGGAGALDILYSIAQAIDAKMVIETGVAYGWSSFAILCSLDERQEGQLISIDRPYPGLNNEAYVGAVIPDDLRHRWLLLRGSDRNMLPIALEKATNLDFAHYDSDKTYEGRMFAYPLIWNALKPGGVLMSDDIGDNMAFIEFARASSAPFKIIKHEAKHVGIMVKPV